MPTTAVALVLVAGLLHALWNVVAKKTGGGAHFVLMGAVMIVVLWSPLGLALAWRDCGPWRTLEWGTVLASGLAHLAYFRTLLAGYRAADLTVVYPVARGTGPLLASGAAVLLLGESLGAIGVAGVLAVTGGVWLIAGGPRMFSSGPQRTPGPSAASSADAARAGGRPGRTHGATQRERVRAGLAWGAATGALIATYTVIDGYAVKVLAISPILIDWLGNALRIPFMLPGALADRAGFVRDLRAQWKAALLLALISPLAYVLVLFAVQMAPLSHVAPAREVSMLFAALLGGRLLGEGDRGWRLLGAACIAGGVAALAAR